MRLARATSQPAGRAEGRRGWGAARVLLALAICMGTGAWSAAGAGEGEALDAEQRRELEHLLEDVADADLSAERRRRAAAILLHRGWEQALAALGEHLRGGAEAGARRAVAQALAEAEEPDRRFIEPLMEALAAEGEEGGGVRRDAAAALRRYEAPELVARLIELAVDPDQPAARRRGAVAALAEHRRREVADALVTVAADRSADEAVRAEAFEALERLTGRADLSRDAEAWARWREQMAGLGDERWLGALMRNLAARNAELAADLEAANERVVSLYQRLYEATPEEGRAAVLVQLLGEPMPELRLLAMRLIDRRILNAQPIDDTVREAMRQGLADPEASARVRAAELLENLADADAAERAAELLAGDREERVQAAYLALLARVPRAEAVGAALELIEREGLRRAAASFLLAAHEARLLDADQAERALASARRLLDEEAEPPVLRLLGRIGGDDDLERIVAYLGAGARAPLRLAAVEALSGERWPLAPLLDHLGDEVVGSAVVNVIGRRGGDSDTFLALLEHEPNGDETDGRERWLEAAVAVAGRLGAGDLARADRALAEMPDHVELHERCLAAAAGIEASEAGENGAGAGGGAEARVEALLRLGELYLRTGRPDKAREAYEPLVSRDGLGAGQRRRLVLGRVESELRAEPPRLGEAGEVTRTALAEAGESWAAVLARLWLDAAERALDAEASAAAELLEVAESLFDGQLNGDELSRMAELSGRL